VDITTQKYLRRLDILDKFKKQLVRFLRKDNQQSTDYTPEDLLGDQVVKTYYLKNLKGLII
jgi:hypothetical protein